MADFASLLDELQVSPPDRTKLLDILQAMPDEHRMRALWLQPTRLWVQREAPGLLPSVVHFDRHFPVPTPFGFVPASRVLLTILRIATLLAPEAPLPETANWIVRDVAEKLLVELTILKPLITACDGDLKLFLQFSCQSQKIFYDYGLASFEILDAKHWQMHFEGHSYGFSAHYLRGYFEGIIAAFGYTGQITLERHADFDCTIDYAEMTKLS